MEKSNKKHHFVLMHGLGQGAWSWYKVKTLLVSLGHQVTALDLAASGTNLKKLSDVHTFLEYSEPLLQLMETIPNKEKVILVGHSLGGMNIAYAIERYPEKVDVVVFLTAFMPDTSHPPSSYVFEKMSEFFPKETFLDTLFSLDESCEKPKVTILFGPKFSSSMLYQLSPPEDYTLGMTLLRVGSMFREDLSTAGNFSEEGYGSVHRAYIVSRDDKLITEDFQRWMITNSPVKEEKAIEGSDHFLMFSKPQEVCNALIWSTYYHMDCGQIYLVFCNLGQHHHCP